MSFFSKLFGRKEEKPAKPAKPEPSVHDDTGTLKLDQWKTAFGKVFEMYEYYDESKTESFKLVDATINPDNGYVYLLMTSVATGAEDVFSYYESEPTHIVKTVDGAEDEFAGADLISYTEMAKYSKPEEIARAFALFKH